NCVHQCKLVSVFFDPFGEKHETARALLDWHARPLDKASFRRLHRAIDVSFGCEGNAAELIHIRRVDRYEALTLGRRHPLSSDEETAGLEIKIWGFHFGSLDQGTIAARSTLRSEAFLKAKSRSLSANLESTMSLNGNRLR